MCNICKKNLKSSLARHKTSVHGIIDDEDNTVYKKIPIAPFERNSTNLTYPALIVHAINAHQGKATKREIVQWIQSNFDHYKRMPVKSVDSAINQSLWDHNGFFSKKMMKNGKTETYWCVHRLRWFAATKRKKSIKKIHKPHIIKEKTTLNGLVKIEFSYEDSESVEGF